jgi:hypothetical protein
MQQKKKYPTTSYPDFLKFTLSGHESRSDTRKDPVPHQYNNVGRK